MDGEGEVAREEREAKEKRKIIIKKEKWEKKLMDDE